jgi:hypothetical protein
MNVQRGHIQRQNRGATAEPTGNLDRIRTEWRFRVTPRGRPRPPMHENEPPAYTPGRTDEGEGLPVYEDVRSNITNSAQPEATGPDETRRRPSS